MPIPNETSSESSPIDVSSADLLSTDTIPTIPTVKISTMEHRPRGGDIPRRRVRWVAIL